MNPSPTPLVSIRVVTRNRRADLLRARASCAAQDYRPIETLVCDGHSSEETAEAVRERFPEVRLVLVEDDPGFPAGLFRPRRASGPAGRTGASEFPAEQTTLLNLPARKTAN